MRFGNSIMMRSFAESMGVTWPRDIALVSGGEPVTWAEVHAARTAASCTRLVWPARLGRELRPRMTRIEVTLGEHDLLDISNRYLYDSETKWEVRRWPKH